MMHTNTVKRMTIQKEINLIPESKLDEVKIYIETILNQADVNKPKPVSLKGIWYGMGFEKKTDVETEIYDLRQNLSSRVLNKKI